MHLVTQEAQVVAVHSASVEVVACATGGCSSCSLAPTCGQSLLSRYFGRKNPSLTVASTSNLQVGDKILVGLEANSLNLAAVLQFLLPLLTLLAAAIFAQSLGLTSNFGLLLVALFGLGFGLVLARYLAKPPQLKIIRQLH